MDVSNNNTIPFSPSPNKKKKKINRKRKEQAFHISPIPLQ